jgi:uncharacterized lipoprotein YmbA
MKNLKILLLCALLPACSSAPVTFYTLSAQGSQAPARSSAISVEVGPVTLPVYLDRPQLVLADQSRRLTILDQSRWAGPLPRMLAQTLADDISRELGLSQVHAYPQASPYSSDYALSIDVRSLQGSPGQGVHLDAAWSMLQAGRRVAQGRFVADEATRTDSIDALVAAHDRVLAAFAHTLAQAMLPLL